MADWPVESGAILVPRLQLRTDIMEPRAHRRNSSSKMCRVCGDAARCHHFGGLCCASCKAFFRRSVVKDQYKEYRCIYGGSCAIDVTTRKHCSHCRLKNCLAIGMDKKWFMSEEMRAELKRKALLKASQTNRTNDNNRLWLPARPFRPDQDRFVYLSDDQKREIDGLSALYIKSFGSFSLPTDLQNQRSCHASNATTAVTFSVCLKRVAKFAQSIPQMCQLSPRTQEWILKNRILEAVIVGGTMSFDPITKMFTSNHNTLFQPAERVHICAHDFERLHGEALMKIHFNLLCSLLNLKPDLSIIHLLSIIVLFRSEENDNPDNPMVTAIQDHFTHLLKMYLRSKLGPFECERTFDRFILKLSDVRQTSNLHQLAKLRLTSQDIRQIEDQMGGLRLLTSKPGSPAGDQPPNLI